MQAQKKDAIITVECVKPFSRQKKNAAICLACFFLLPTPTTTCCYSLRGISLFIPHSSHFLTFFFLLFLSLAHSPCSFLFFCLQFSSLIFFLFHFIMLSSSLLVGLMKYCLSSIILIISACAIAIIDPLERIIENVSMMLLIIFFIACLLKQFFYDFL